MGFDFSLVDVFTDRPFGGNRLAVFPDATGMADATMQQLAREFSFSETTFVLPPGEPSCTRRVRIFTPRKEDGRITEVVVSGFAAIVGHGTMTIRSG
jgi:trans-2,3-dihydro-3-hydroxyanthranilate isomerase